MCSPILAKSDSKSSNCCFSRLVKSECLSEEKEEKKSLVLLGGVGLIQLLLLLLL